jgi:S1-C subfamily serine protease
MIVQRLSTALLIVLVSIPAAFGQVATFGQTKPTRTAPANPGAAENRTVAPQVVTVLHRLNGLKVFRLLLLSGQDIEAIANLDQTFRLMDDVHTNVTAGVALEDGQTIAAWLPEADVELPVPFQPSEIPTWALAAPGIPSPKLTAPRNPTQTVRDEFEFRSHLFGSPDLTVIDSEGKKMVAQFVGVDGSTGLSILKLSRKMPAPPPPLKEGDVIVVGEGVRLLGPEPVPPSRRFGFSNLYVRIGEASGTISTVKQAPSGDVARLKVRTPRLLSSANVGAVAVNETGETVGIINAIEGSEASILPAALIRRAAKRVLAQQASVPRPWLGVKGDPIALVQLSQLQQQGWEMMRASNLAQAQRGILLTSIMPDSPAASAALKPGDVILKVNDEDIQTADDFSWLLDEAGSSSSVEFTVARPERKAEELVRVVLSASPRRPPAPPRPAATTKTRWLVAQGIETIALRPVVAARFGSSPGLLVVYVEPASPAFEAGLQPGDVIETIDGRSALANGRPAVASTQAPDLSTFEIVRKKQKLVIAVAKSAQNKK